VDERDDIELAHRLATTASEIALRHARTGIRHQLKADGSPVTDADLEIEQTLVGMIAATNPGDAVHAEESGSHGPASSRRWIIDPIDGTASYLTGGRAWGTHIALEVDGVISAAVLSRPTEDRLWWAVRGEGAYASRVNPMSADIRVMMSKTSRLADARVGGFDPPSASAAARAMAARAQWVQDQAGPVAGLLEGRLDVVLDEGGKPWDQAPCVLLVTEAGGIFSDPCGGSRIDMGWAFYGNPSIHAALWPTLKITFVGD
jgi:histidinol-phosphatase